MEIQIFTVSFCQCVPSPAELTHFWSLLSPIEYQSRADIVKAILKTRYLSNWFSKYFFKLDFDKHKWQHSLYQKADYPLFFPLFIVVQFFLLSVHRYSFAFNYLETNLNGLTNSEYLERCLQQTQVFHHVIWLRQVTKAYFDVLWNKRNLYFPSQVAWLLYLISPRSIPHHCSIPPPQS